MRIHLLHNAASTTLESEEPIMIMEALKRAGITTSMVLVTHGNRILPHTTLIKSDIELEVIDVGSGG